MSKTQTCQENDLPLVSIGLPVRNGGRYLRETLASLVAQDWPNFEIIVSDNESEDGTPAILEEFSRNDARIRVYRQESALDVLDNFLFVLRKSKGEFFCWNAHDDLRKSGSIREMVETMIARPSLVCVMGDVENLDEETGVVSVDKLEKARISLVEQSWREIRKRFFEVPISNVFFCFYGLFRTEAIRTVELKMGFGFNAHLEIPFLAQVALRGEIATIDSVGFVYRRHRTSLYHMEIENDEPCSTLRRHGIVRRHVTKLLLCSSLPFSEKLYILGAIMKTWREEARSERMSVAEMRSRKRLLAAKARERESRLRERERAKEFRERMKRRSKSRFWRLKGRLVSAVERRLFGAKPPNPVRPVKRGDPDTSAHLDSLSDEEMLDINVNLGSPNLRILIRQEEARRRLVSRGWRFEREKIARLMDEREISTIIDCGANSGQFVEGLYSVGWRGKVYSFEPLSTEYSILREKTLAAADWTAYRFALGENPGEAEIRVAGNSFSSSLLEFSDSFKELVPEADPVRTEKIRIKRLDDFVEEERLTFPGPVLLKLDVQGFELRVLKGAGEFLNRVDLVQTEMALVPSYENAPNFTEVKEFLNSRGFVLIHLLDGHSSPVTGELREVDGIFANTARLKGA